MQRKSHSRNSRKSSKDIERLQPTGQNSSESKQISPTRITYALHDSETDLSRIWRDRLGVAMGAALALATIWLFLVSAAAVVVLRA